MKRTFLRNMVYGLCVCVAVTSLLTGCTSLRKKFTRKKKKDFTEEFEPVLNPVDYPPASTSVLETYAYHASLRRVWHKSLMEAIAEESSDKRIKYYFDQMLVEVEAMIALLADDKKAFAGQVLEKLQAVRKEFDKPSQLRQGGTIERKLRLIDGDIQDELKNDAVKGHLVPSL